MLMPDNCDSTYDHRGLLTQISKIRIVYQSHPHSGGNRSRYGNGSPCALGLCLVLLSGCRSAFLRILSVYPIRVKRAPKADPVKHRPPDPATFTYWNLPCLEVYILITSPVLTNSANAPSVAGSRQHLVRRLISSPFATSTAPLELDPLASPACHRFHLALDKPQQLVYITLSNEPHAVNDVGDDVYDQLGARRVRLYCV